MRAISSLGEVLVPPATTPRALFRVGTAEGPALDAIRTAASGAKLVDVDVVSRHGVDFVQPFVTKDGGLAGVSLYDQLKQMLVRHVAFSKGTRCFWELAAGSHIPAQLLLQPDAAARGHFLLGPAQEMPLDAYRELLAQFSQSKPPGVSWRRWESVPDLIDALALPDKCKRKLLEQPEVPSKFSSPDVFLGAVLLGYCDHLAGTAALDIDLAVFTDLWDIGEALAREKMELTDLLFVPVGPHRARLGPAGTPARGGELPWAVSGRGQIRRYNTTTIAIEVHLVPSSYRWVSSAHLSAIQDALRWKQAELEARIDGAADLDESYDVANGEGVLWEELCEWAGM